MVDVMAVVEFVDEDELFRAWLAKHLTGFVVNVDRGRSDQKCTRIHRAACPTLALGTGCGERQTESYIKVCSTHGRELDDWAKESIGGGLRELRCKHCSPSNL